jgi:hypothetical protein
MRKKLLSILALTILVTSTLVGCSGASSAPSTLTILSINEGDVFVMKAGTDDWTEATVEMSLEVGDTIKTGDDSGAEITFFDGSTIELEAGTQIEIASLDSSPDTGAKTITLMQTIGTTISRVTKLLDPASTYAIETPSGVAAVRGSIMIVRIIFGDPNYEDGTVLITTVEGDVWAIWQGVELQIPEGYTCVIRFDQLLELIPPNEPPQEESGDATDEDTANGQDVTDEDTTNGQSEDLQPGSSPTDSLQMPPPPTVVYSDPGVFQTPATPPPGGETPPTDGQTPPPGDETTATIRITSNPSKGPIYIWDATAEEWITNGGKLTPEGIEVPGDHYYYVWVGADVTYDPTNYPEDWTKEPAPEGYDTEAAYGCAAEDSNTPLHFSETED